MATKKEEELEVVTGKTEEKNKNTGFTYDPYQSSGAVDKAKGEGFTYDNFTYDPYKSSGAVDKAKGNGFSYDNFSYADYAPSETVQQAQSALQAIQAAQPGAYQSKWQSQVDSIINKILNREAFSYDFNEDALYKQYADQYTRGGKLAMQDTMGQAAAMTGGYGSSYASTAGNQAYQEYMSKLNEVIPELYGMALDRYKMEGEEMYNQYGLLSAQEQQDYGRYMDSYNQWLTERDYATGRYDTERNFDYSKYNTDREFAYGQYSDNKSYAYNDYRNAIEDAKWKEQQEYNQYVDSRNFDYGVYADDKSYAYNDYRNAIEDAKWMEETEYNRYLADRGLAYDDHLAAIQNEQWGKEFEEGVRQYNETMGFNKDVHNAEMGYKYDALEQDASQFSETMGYNYDVLEQDKYEFDTTTEYNEKVHADTVAQWGVENGFTQQQIDEQIKQNRIQNGFTEKELEQKDRSLDQADRELDMKEEAWKIEKGQIKDSEKLHSGKGYNNGTLTVGQLKDLQAVLGVDTDGLYGPKTKEAAGGLTADEAYAKYVLGTSDEVAEAYSSTTSKLSEGKELSASDIKGISTQVSDLVDNEDLEGAEAYLTLLYDNGYISEAQLMSFLAPYVEVEESETVDTSVPTTSTGSNTNTVPTTTGSNNTRSNSSILSTSGTNYPTLVSPEEAGAFANAALTPEGLMNVWKEKTQQIGLTPAELMKLWKEKGQWTGLTPEEWVKTLK